MGKSNLEIIDEKTFINNPTKKDGKRVFVEIPQEIREKQNVDKTSKVKCEILENNEGESNES